MDGDTEAMRGKVLRDRLADASCRPGDQDVCRGFHASIRS
jgi:hypothetical protein